MKIFLKSGIFLLVQPNFISRNRRVKLFYILIMTSLQGRVVRKPVNANPGLKVNQSIDFSCIKIFFITYDFCSLRLFKRKTEGQTM